MAQFLFQAAFATGLHFLSRALTPGQNFENEGPRLGDAQITSSTEGSPISRTFGSMRLGGNLIWTTDFKETVVKTKQKVPNQGKGGGKKDTITNTEYRYSASFAIALCEGHDKVKLGRIWLDGKLQDKSKLDVNFYPGSQTQTADPIMEAVEGTGQVPAYRGTAYIVFDDLQLANYGNRIPQVTAEIMHSLPTTTMEDLIEGVTVIPASGEFAYATNIYGRTTGNGGTVIDNVHNSEGIANAVVSNNVLEDCLPNLGSTLVVSSWFGNDLRAGECEIRPKVEREVEQIYSARPAYVHYIQGAKGQKITITPRHGDQRIRVQTREGDIEATASVDSGDTIEHTFARDAIYTIVSLNPDDTFNTTGSLEVSVFAAEQILQADWQVSGLSRAQAEVVPLLNGRIVYGGTPSDVSLMEYIRDCKSRGWKVVFYPFILMDQLTGNGLPDPYGAAEQAPLPWRGRITVHPAEGQPNTTDGTSAATSQMTNFFGAATAAQVPAGADGLPGWTGAADEWGYRRMVLHYARLCQMAGGVDAFIIGSELRGLTTARNASGFPAVTRLRRLARDCRTILGASTKISYAADWSEWNGVNKFGADFYFHLDLLWADPDIDFIGVDNYLPLSDWRDGTTHADWDEANGITSPYVKAYLKDNVEGGENYDWFYASTADRDAQTRTPITDGAYGKPWIYRQKDFRNWWDNRHYNRVNGIEQSTPTGWTARLKPFWFTEMGCPAVDKGSNQPNVFYDPKSSESALPYFSRGNRDDLIQRRYIEAMIEYWRDNGAAGFIEPENIFVWTWDVRPYPAFPGRRDVWSDGDNWQFGHWLTGRLGLVPLSDLVSYLVQTYGQIGPPDVREMDAASSIVRGYLIDRIMSARDMLQPLMIAHTFDGFETEGRVKFALRSRSRSVPLDLEKFAKGKGGGYALTRIQETEIPSVMKIAYYNADKYDAAAVDGRKLGRGSHNAATNQLPMVLTDEHARGLADIMLQELWAARNSGEFALPHSQTRIDPSDTLLVNIAGRLNRLRVQQLGRGDTIDVEAFQFDRSVYESLDYVAGTPLLIERTVVAGQAIAEFPDLPLITGEEELPWAPHAVARAVPWPGAVNVYEDDLAGGWEFNTAIGVPANLGILTEPLARGPVDRWDRGNVLEVDLYSGELESTSALATLAGANTLAIRTPSGGWEVVRFQTATLTPQNTYRCTGLLRGQLGTESEMTADPVPSGARVLLLEERTPLDITLDQLNAPMNLRYGPNGIEVADPRYTSSTHTFRGVGLLPYAPVHLRSQDDTAGVRLSWVRRTRFSGDAWAPPNVPLNEESEAYEVDIVNGSGAVVRTLNASMPEVLYPAALRTADGLGAFAWRVYQMSAVIGRGRAAVGAHT